jgi:hypothetical protein
MHESQLHRVQVPSDQDSPMVQGLLTILSGGSFLCEIVFLSVVNILILKFQIFHKRMPPEAVDLVSRLLQYSPNLRCTAVSTCTALDK